MVIMALDHVRDYFHNQSQLFAPEDLAQNRRLAVLHPVDHALLRAGVRLPGRHGGLSVRAARPEHREVSRFLWTRGLWLVLLELTVVASFGWDFGVNPNAQGLAVIWALGWSMVALAAAGLRAVACRCSSRASAMIVLHNTLDGVRPEQFGAPHWLWRLLHVQRSVAAVERIWAVRVAIR